MAVYLKVGNQGIIQITGQNFNDSAYTHYEQHILIPTFFHLDVKCLVIEQKHDDPWHCDKIRVTFKTSKSRDDFLENNFSNGGTSRLEARLEEGMEKIDKLESKIDELKELIYFSSLNGPGFKEARKDFEGQREKIEKE